MTIPANMPDIRCKICDTGILQKIKRYRMSGVVVVIGYILLIPSVIGILFSGYMFWETALHTNESSSSGLAAAGAVEVFSIGLAIAFLVGGLLGWLLIMKKEILQCNRCGAVVAAS